MPPSLKQRYEQLFSDREPFLIKGRTAAELTIPSILPPRGHSNLTEYPTPYQSIGAQGVNNLSSKLLLTLLPPNTSCFRLTITDFTLKNLEAEARGEVEEGLAQIERAAMEDIEAKAVRVPVFEALKHLLIVGNALLYMEKSGATKIIPLEQYVVRRDGMGNILEIIILEAIDKSLLPTDVRERVGAEGDTSVYKNYDLYTGVFRSEDGKSFEVWQEVEGFEVPSGRGVYKADKLPFIPLRLMRISGENYGRSFVGEYMGDLISLEDLTKSIVDGASAAARILFLVAPNSATKSSNLAKAANGAFVAGSANDVTTLQLNKSADFSVAERTITRLETRLSLVFLMNSSVQRNAERVTAEEIKFMAQELESALGGVYSLLSLELQLPLMRLILNELQAQKRVPKLPKEVKPVIVTGIEALGRGQELGKLSTLLQYLAPLGADVIAKQINIGDYIKRVVSSLGIDALGLLKTEEQIAQEAQEAQQAQQQQLTDQTMAQMAQKATPELTKQAGQQQEVQGELQ